MQKILIGENCELDIGNKIFISILNQVYEKHSYKEWIDILSKDWDMHEIRTNPLIHKNIIDRNYTLRKEYLGSPEICKIVEIPDDVKWHISTYECGVGEYIVEEHRTWK